MIAKIIVWAEDRATLIERMVQVLKDTVCFGITTNQSFLLALLQHEAFRRGAVVTQFIERSLPELLTGMRGHAGTLTTLITSAHLWRWYYRQQQRKYLHHIPAGYRNVRWQPQSDAYTLSAANGLGEGSSKWSLFYENIGKTSRDFILRCLLLPSTKDPAELEARRIQRIPRDALDINAELLHVDILQELPDLVVANLRCSISKLYIFSK
jgi:hypothetical protein